MQLGPRARSRPAAARDGAAAGRRRPWLGGWGAAPGPPGHPALQFPPGHGRVVPAHDQYPASISQRPSCTTASQARPSSVTSWNRARRRAAAGSHQRSDSGQGPAQPVTRRGGSPRAASRAGGAETAQRPLTVTARPAPSVTPPRGRRGRPGRAPPRTRPGQGRPAGRRGSVFSPNGTGVTCSCAFRPPPRTGRSTASCPSMACTRMAARATRSLTSVSPHRASCCPVARTSWSGASRSARSRPAGTVRRRPAGPRRAIVRRGRRAAVELPADPVGDRGRGQQPVVPPQPAALPPVRPGAPDLHPDAGQPAGGQAVMQPLGQRLGREHHRLGPRFRRVELLGHGQVGGRRAGRQRPGVQAAGQPVRALPRVAEPAGHVAAGSAAKSPSVPRPSRFSSAARSWASRPGPGRPGRSPAGRPGTSPPRPAARPVPSRAARSAANSPSATPTWPATPRSASAAVILAASAVSPPK